MTNGPLTLKSSIWRRRGIRTLETACEPTSLSNGAPSTTRTALHNGSPNRTRTCDNSINSRVLYQLSYQGILLGNVLLSQNPAVQVPSALEGLTVVFGMGTRGSPPPSSPNGHACALKTGYETCVKLHLKTGCETVKSLSLLLAC